MSMVFLDGFDHYNSIDGLGARKWDQGSSGAFGAGRWGGKCLHAADSGNLFVYTWNGATKRLTATPELVVGMALRINPVTPAHPFLIFMDNYVPQCSLWVDPTTFTITMRTGRGTDPGDITLVDTNYVAPLTLWIYLEVKVTIGIAGSVEIRIDGQTVGLATGIQTQQTGNSYTNRFAVTGVAQFSGGSVSVDDLYVINPTDATGLVNFIGEVKIQTKYPNADGNQNDWTRSAGSPSTNYTQVNATNTSYIETNVYNTSGVLNAKDLYNIQDFVVTGSIFAVQENLSFRKDDVGNKSICPLLRTASVEYEGATTFSYSDYTHTSKMWEVNPGDGLPWQLTDLNAAEFGIKVKS